MQVPRSQNLILPDASDKAISTIDPSGVALAAIKQLIKENVELRARIAKLEQNQAK